MWVQCDIMWVQKPNGEKMEDKNGESTALQNFGLKGHNEEN